MAANGYISVDQLKEALRDRTNTHDDLLQQAISASSRQIDQYLGGQVWKTTTPVARVFAAEDEYVLFVDPFATKVGLVVKTDEDEDGVFETTWDAADYQAEPLRGGQDKPYRALAAVGGRLWPAYQYHSRRFSHSHRRRRAQVEITATWGWPSVPWQVVQACQILAIDAFKSKDLTGGLAGANEISAGQFGSFRFSGVEVDSFSPQAKSLLNGLRTLVVS